MVAVDSWDVAELLSRLSDKSLVSWDDDAGRYTMLQTVRQFLEDKVLASEESARLRDEHLRHYRRFAERAEDKLRGPDQVEWMRRFDEEQDNLRAAIDWGIGSSELWAFTTDFALDVFTYWMLRSAYSEGIAALEALLDRAPQHERERQSMILMYIATFCSFTGDPRMGSFAQRGLELGQEVGGLALAFGAFGQAYSVLSNHCYDEAEPLFRQALDLFQEHGELHMVAFCHINLGNMAQGKGDLDQAERHYRDCLALRQELGDIRGIGAVCGGLAQLAERRGDFHEAARLDRISIEAKMKVGDLTGIAGALCSACAAGWIRNDFSLAARILGAADALTARIGIKPDVADAACRDRWVARLREKLGDGFEAEWQAGTTLTLEEAVALVLSGGPETILH